VRLACIVFDLSNTRGLVSCLGVDTSRRRNQLAGRVNRESPRLYFGKESRKTPDTTIEELCFLCGPYRDVISNGQGWNRVNSQAVKRRLGD
jgi:hypothetical protein